GVIHAAAVALAGADLAVVGEPEPAVGVEEQVVRSAQRVAVALRVDRLHTATPDVDALDAPPDVARRLVARYREAGHLMPLEAAVVAHVDPVVGADGGAVRTAARLRHHRHLPVGGDT